MFFFSRSSVPNQELTQNLSIPMADKTQSTNGVISTDINIGTGSEARAGQVVSVHYTGTLQDGTVFDSSVSRGQPFQFVLGVGQVIRGWDQGVAGMKVGGKRQLVISPEAAYGPAGIQNPQTGEYVIPQNATLIFEVELLEVAELNQTQ